MKHDPVALNKRIEAFLSEKAFRNESFSEEDIAFIQQYEGAGGKASKGATGEGLLHEFYTPDYVVELLWKLAAHYNYDGGAVLEPSVGTGRMLKYAPDSSTCVGFEINPVSATIARLSYPEATIHTGFFETAFLEAPRFTRRLKDTVTWLAQYPSAL